MNEMDMNRFEDAYQRASSNQGFLSDAKRLAIKSSHMVRIIGGFEEVWEHFVTLPGGKVRPVLCGGPHTPCPLCQYVAQLMSDAAKRNIAVDMKAKPRYYFNCLDRSPDGFKWHQANKHTMLLTQNEKGANIGPMLLQQIGAVAKMLKEQGKPSDPNGYDLFISRQGTGAQNTKYLAQFTGNMTPLTEEEKKYERYDLKKIAEPTAIAEVNAIVNALKTGVPLSDNTEFDPQQLEQEAKAALDQMERSGQMHQATMQQPQPQPQPQPQQQNRLVPQAQNPSVATAVLPSSPPQQQGEVITDTKVTGELQPGKEYAVPCGDCSNQMKIIIGDKRDFRCWSCGKTYRSPWNK